jgi:hypothetical protein
MAIVEPTASRRGFLGRVAGVFAGAAVAKVGEVASLEPTGPITPEAWYAEMQAMGWTAVASVFRGEPVGVIEYAQRREDGSIDYDAFHRTLDGRYRLSGRVNQSGADFFKRTSRVALRARPARERRTSDSRLSRPQQGGG